MVHDDELIPVVILALLEEPVMHSPVVILHDPESNRILPIWIGEPEARAIAIAYQGVETSRPLTHNLFAGTLHELGVELSQVVIERVESTTYYASLYLRAACDDEELIMDARPSDAIALALESGAPLYVAQSVLQKAGQNNPFPAPGAKSAMPEVAESLKAPKSVNKKKLRAKETFTDEEMTQLNDLLSKAREREYEEGGDVRP